MTKKSGETLTPQDHQFKKGQSGNPKGHPKKKKPESELSPLGQISARTFKARANGEVRNLTAPEILRLSVFNKAMTGNGRAIREVFKWIKKYRQNQHKQCPRCVGPTSKTKIEAVDPRNSDAALLLLKIICIDDQLSDPEGDYVHHWLEPAAVQKALSRRGGVNRLSEETLLWIQSYTRNGQSLRLPRQR